MIWISAAVGLLVVLLILVIGPYLGIYGTRDPLDDAEKQGQKT